MSLANKMVLVTGATGFLGGRLAQRLAENGVQVRALARSPHKADFLRGDDPITVVQGDITDAARMVEVTQGCDVVFHVAAALGGSIQHQQHVNVDGTRSVMQAAAAANVTRVVHISSIAVYGYRYQTDITEDMPMCPSAEPYSITKAMAENVVHEVATPHGLSASIVRPGMIYGPRSNAWTKTLFRLARMRPTPFFGKGEGFAPVIFVDDVVDLAITAATHPAADGETFNVTSDPSTTWREFLGAYAKLAGHQRWLALPPGLLYVVARIGALGSPAQSQRRALPDLAHMLQTHVTYKMTRARDLLGWQAQVDLQSGIQQCAPWLRELGLL